MRNLNRICLIALLALAGNDVYAPSSIPTDWIDPNTGHRVIRLSREDGGQSSYFHQNEFTPDGKWIVFRSNLFGPSHVFEVEVAKAKQ